MKRRPKPLLLTLILLPIIAFAAFYFSRSRQMPSEAEILANFKTHKATFRKLAQMAKSDGIVYLTQTSGKMLSSYSPNPEDGVETPATLVQRYAPLMKEAGVIWIGGRDVRPMRFRVAGGQRGLLRGWSLGFAWENLYSGARSYAVPLVSSAYQIPPKRPGFLDDANFTFSKIEPSWFLYRSES